LSFGEFFSAIVLIVHFLQKIQRATSLPGLRRQTGFLAPVQHCGAVLLFWSLS
jgi:hypothetical protein